MIDNDDIKAILKSSDICESECYASSEQNKLEEQESQYDKRHIKEVLAH